LYDINKSSKTPLVLLFLAFYIQNAEATEINIATINIGKNLIEILTVGLVSTREIREKIQSHFNKRLMARYSKKIPEKTRKRAEQTSKFLPPFYSR